jgi:hypothetical protein
MKKFLSKYLELVFTVLGLIVILAVPALFSRYYTMHLGAAYPWRVAAITAIAVGTIHGILFYIVRSRQRESRERVIRDVRHLSDVVCNQLQVVVFSRHADSENDLLEAAHAIQRHVADLH